MWSGKFVVRYIIKGYDILLNTPWKCQQMVQKNDIKGVTAMLKMLRRMKYNNLILPQEETFFFRSPKKQTFKNHPTEMQEKHG